MEPDGFGSLALQSLWSSTGGSLVFMTKVFLTLATWLITTGYLVNRKQDYSFCVLGGVPGN